MMAFPQLAQKIHSLDFANAMTMTEICFASSRFPRTTAQPVALQAESQRGRSK
jgi:hypothetical protein